MSQQMSSVSQYCAEIGKDAQLVQGAGGNVSWKEDKTLWVKASGTWLANAERDNIFVPVDLSELRNAVALGNFAIKPALLSVPGNTSSNYRPSIETLLHALMPQKFVVHLHAIDVLAHLVRMNCRDTLEKLLRNRIRWAMVDYFKPGSELAQAIHNALNAHPDAQVILMKNHGLVVGGESIDDIRQILQTVIGALRVTPEQQYSVTDAQVTPPAIEGYQPIADPVLHQLACNARLFSRLDSDWALYPDHVVFLGAHAHRVESAAQLQSMPPPEKGVAVFIRDSGVLVSNGFSEAQLVQLRCYYDILVRQPDNASLASLASDQVRDLLARDDEKFRIQLTRQ